MAIPRKQIGWGADTNLLWGIWKALDRLTQVTSKNKPVEPEPTEPVNNRTFTLTSKQNLLGVQNFEVSETQSFITTISAMSLLEGQIYYLALYNGSSGPGVEPKFLFPIPTHTQGAGFVFPISDDGALFKAGITGAILSYIPGGVPPEEPLPIEADKVFLNFTYKQTA
jgi:hypothetical protein